MTTTDEVPSSFLAIEEATRAELLAIYRIEQRCFPQPWPYTAFEYHLDAVAFLLAKVDGRVVGYVVSDRVDGFPGPVGHIKDLAVDPEFRRRGIARRLLAQALLRLEAAGAIRAELEVRRGNDAARTLYREFGFERRGSRPGYYVDGEDAIVLIRPLEGEVARMLDPDRDR